MTSISTAVQFVRRDGGLRTSTPKGDRPVEDRDLAPFAWVPVSVTAAAMCTLELLVASRYGFHRDELYFLASAHHLAWGYVDQPPLVPAVARLALIIFGPSVFWLRALPAMAGAATVVISALTARELGGRRIAQLIAGMAAATSAQALAAFHLLSTTAFDVFFWSVITLLVSRMLRTCERRLWMAIGVVTGVALLDKLNVLFLVAALVISLAVSPQRQLLWSRWLAVGAALALLLASPDIAWNATHQWAQLSMTHSLQQENSTLGASLTFIPAQFIVVGIVLAWVWVPGLMRLLKDQRVRSLGVAYLVLLVALFRLGRKALLLVRDVLRPVRGRRRGHRGKARRSVRRAATEIGPAAACDHGGSCSGESAVDASGPP